MKKYIGFVLVLLLTFAVLPANAQLDANSNTSVNGSADLPGGSVDGTLDGNADVNVGGDSEDDNNTQSDTNSEGSLEVNASGVAVVSSSQVNSEADLQVLSLNLTVRDSSVAKVDVKSNNTGESSVKVVYRHRGMFLGFLPVTIKSTTIVDAKAGVETKVTSKLAWWGFLVAKVNYSKADLESRIRNNATVRANAKVNASASAKAQVAEAVVSEVKAHASAQGEVTK